MKILVLHSSSDLYGASKILLQTVGYLSKKGHKIVVVLSEEGPLGDLIRKEGCAIYIIKLGVLRRKYFTPKGLANRITVIKKAKKNLEKIIRENQVDIIYSNTTSVLVGAFLAKKMHVRHVWHIHEIITQRWLLKTLGFLINKYSDKVIVVSHAVKRHWEKYVNKDKLCVIYNGLDYKDYFIVDGVSVRKELGLSADKILIGMIGRVHPWKGQIYFLNIARKVLDVYPQVKFVMVGDVFPGNEYLYDEIDRIKSGLGIQSNIIDLGYRKDIPEILSAIDIFVLPSTSPDPLPTVVLEAMAASKPVVVTAQGGSLEMVDNNITGFLIPWNDPLKASKAVLSLITSGSLRENMGKEGQKRVQTFFSKKAYFENIDRVLFPKTEDQKGAISLPALTS